MAIKNILLAVLLLISKAGLSQSPYALSVEKLRGELCSLSLFQGKKMLIVAFHADSLDSELLTRLDSIFKVNSDRLVVIGMPLLNTNDTPIDSSLARVLLDELHLSFVISKPLKVRKRDGESQSELAKWLTHSSANGHFNKDINRDGQMFILNERGALFGIFHKDTPSFILAKAINKPLE